MAWAEAFSTKMLFISCSFSFQVEAALSDSNDLFDNDEETAENSVL